MYTIDKKENKVQLGKRGILSSLFIDFWMYLDSKVKYCSAFIQGKVSVSCCRRVEAIESIK